MRECVSTALRLSAADLYGERTRIRGLYTKVPQEGSYPALRTFDGELYVDTEPEGRTHVMFAKFLGLDPTDIRSGGWVRGGVYDESSRSDVSRWAEQARAKKRVQERRKMRSKVGGQLGGKFLSFVLRHKPEAIGLSLDRAGWANVAGLIGALRSHGRTVDRAGLDKIVAEDEKGRFEYSPDGTKIRACQGHSIKDLDLGLEPRKPPDKLFHGTAGKTLNAIYAEGIQPRGRQYVHLSWDAETATKVGSRHGRPVVIEVDAGRMHGDGHEFFLSNNNVWLTKSVPKEYLGDSSVIGDSLPRLKRASFDPKAVRERRRGLRPKQSSGGIPAALRGLAAEARKCGSFEEFERDFLGEIKHGTYWHWTEDPNFEIDPSKGPRDMSSLSTGRTDTGKLMVTSHLDAWSDYGPGGEGRPYAALIDMSDVPRGAYRQVRRGFGNEFYVSDPSKARVEAVYPRGRAFQVDKERAAALPQSSRELEEFYDKVVKQ